MTRIINWGKETQDDYEKLKEASSSGLSLIQHFANNLVPTPSLDTHYFGTSSDERTQLAKDLLDLYTGDAKFPEQKYYVKLLDRDEGYLNYQHFLKEFFVDNKNEDGDDGYQTRFTMDEIETIDPRYKRFAVPVED